MTDWILPAILAALVIYTVLIYNGLVMLRNEVRKTYSQIDVQLQRRHDLIPNLVDTARAYMTHERETLEAVTRARQQAEDARRTARTDPGKSGVLAALMGAEQALGGALGKLLAVVEAYPELQAAGNVAELQAELSATEDRIATAREDYNTAVTRYNVRREQFPDLVVARPLGFDPALQWRLADSRARNPVRVDFS